MLAGAGVCADSARHLAEGYSTDLKYVASSRSGDLLVRISPLSEKEQRIFEFGSIAKLREHGVRCSEPIAFDSFEEWCFGVYGFIPGTCSLDGITEMTQEQQHAFGCAAGEQLRLIHDALQAPFAVDDFELRGGKYRKHTAELAALGLPLSGHRLAHHYVTRNLHLLKGRPTTFRHGDFHLGNLIADGPNLVGVIDFNRCDWGDPYDDFYKTAYFGAPYSAKYARGVVQAYFGGEPPPEFWPIYNVYVAAVLPADMVWTFKCFPNLMDNCIARCEWVTGNHDFVGGGTPLWWG